MLRFALSGRWVPWHVLWLVIISLLVAAGIWQWSVAFDNVEIDGQPNTSMRNLVYAVQWWVFAVFALWFWWRFLRDQRDAELAELQQAAADAPDGQMEGLQVNLSQTEDSASTPSADNTISLEGSAQERRARARRPKTDPPSS